MARDQGRVKIEKVEYRVTAERRRWMELCAAHLTQTRGRWFTLTDVIDEALKRLAKEIKVHEQSQG